MNLRGFTRLLHRAVHPGAAQEALLSEPHFAAALRRERLRADRSMSGFSLLTVTLTRHAETALAEIDRVLASRVRESDIAGWCADKAVGIILPETEAAGAWKLAKDLQALLEPRKIAVKFQVYAYPTVDTREGELAAGAACSPLSATLADEPVQPLEALFAQKLPLAKRAVDILAAGTGLLLASPVMLVAAVAIKWASPGPIFFRQLRDGLGGRRFYIYKFRTMVVDADAIKASLRAQSEQDGPAFKLKSDPRVTPIGRLLRRTCIDELPQLWNVLRGDMSVVGPRPMCSKEARQCASWERRRLDVTPGLTCTWQVFGGTKVSFTEWMRMDLRYIGTFSLWNDLRLIVLTVPSIIRRDGVY